MSAMVQTRSMTRRKKSNNDGGATAWSFLNHDLLLLIMMQLEIVDYFSFGKVCRSWRSLALSNRDKFMTSKQPMALFVSSYDKESYYLGNFEGRKFKTVFPTFSARTCIGLSCGYLIMFGKRTHDFLLVNPITRHQLHFPVFHMLSTFNPARIRAILIFSPSMSGWVLLIIVRCTRVISFSLAGEKACWNYFWSSFCHYDLHAFKGKIYTMSMSKHLFEMRLNSVPTLIRLKFKNPPELSLLHAEFVSSDNNLYVLGFVSERVYVVYEMDFEKKIWTSALETIEDHDFFLGDLKCGAVVKRGTWDEPGVPFEMSAGLLGSDNNRKSRFLNAHLWYFPHVYSNVNLLEE